MIARILALFRRPAPAPLWLRVVAVGIANTTGSRR